MCLRTLKIRNNNRRNEQYEYESHHAWHIKLPMMTDNSIFCHVLENDTMGARTIAHTSACYTRNANSGAPHFRNAGFYEQLSQNATPLIMCYSGKTGRAQA